MNLEAAMVAVKRDVEGELVRFFERKRKEARSVHPKTEELVDAVGDVTMRGGKRIRPFLCWLGFFSVIARTPTLRRGTRQSPVSPVDKLGVRNDTRSLLHAMMALELFQTFAIIHDDIMDSSTTRRGGQSVQEYFRTIPGIVSRTHFGTSMAILAGDLAIAWADITISKIKNQKSKMIYQQMKEEVIYGQALDVLREQAGEPIPKEKIRDLKTARYSVSRPLQIGAALAGSPKQLLEKLGHYGSLVGRAFQLRDDLLDHELSRSEFERHALPAVKEAQKLGLGDLFGAFAQFVVEREI